MTRKTTFNFGLRWTTVKYGKLPLVTLTKFTTVLIILKCRIEKLTIRSGFGSYFALDLMLKSVAPSVWQLLVQWTAWKHVRWRVGDWKVCSSSFNGAFFNSENADSMGKISWLVEKSGEMLEKISLWIPSFPWNFE